MSFYRSVDLWLFTCSKIVYFSRPEYKRKKSKKMNMFVAMFILGRSSIVCCCFWKVVYILRCTSLLAPDGSYLLKRLLLSNVSLATQNVPYMLASAHWCVCVSLTTPCICVWLPLRVYKLQQQNNYRHSFVLCWEWSRFDVYSCHYITNPTLRRW